MAKEFRSQVHGLDCPVALQFISELGEKIAPQLSGERPAYQFTLIADDNGDPAHEPYPLPGGYIFVPAKLILKAQSEAEVAQMLAHAMARRFTAVKGGSSIPLVWIPSFDRSPSLAIPRSFQAQQDEMNRQTNSESDLALTAAGYELTRNQPPSAAFLTIQGELRRLLPDRPAPTLERKPPTLLR
jgi:hypothetical protein